MSTTTFERIQQPAQNDPEPHTPGPFVRYGVMVRDTTDTTGGMFCVRQGRPIVNHAGRTVIQHGDAIGYAHRRADGDLFAAAPAMLAALRAILPYAESRLEDMEECQRDAYENAPVSVYRQAKADAEKAREAFEAAQAAIAAAEGRS